MKFRDCTSMNSTEIIQEGYRNGLSKTAPEFKNCKQQLFALTMCLPACLWAQIAKTPFNYTITAQTLLTKCDHYRFQRLIFQFPALGKKYRITGMCIITRASTSRCWAKRKWLHVLWDNWNHFLNISRNKTWKHSAEKYHDLTMKFIHSAVELTPLHPRVCLHPHICGRNLILRCLTGSHMTILSTSNCRVRHYVNMNIANSGSS